MLKSLYIDMDGVLVDQDSAVVGRFGPAPNPEKGEWSYEKRYNNPDFWEDLCPDRDYWWGLKPTEEFLHLLAIMQRYNSYLVTSPLTNSAKKHADCAAGKIYWVHTYLPEYVSRLKLIKHKHELAKRGCLLVDDKGANVNNFRAHGGHGFLVPRPWNHGDESRDWIADLETIIQEI